MLDFLVGRVLIPWVLLRPWLAVATDGDRTRPHGKRKQKICHNIRAVATLLYKALRAVALTPRRFSLSLSLSLLEKRLQGGFSRGGRFFLEGDESVMRSSLFSLLLKKKGARVEVRESEENPRARLAFRG